MVIDNLSKNKYKSHEIYSEYKILDELIMIKNKISGIIIEFHEINKNLNRNKLPSTVLVYLCRVSRGDIYIYIHTKTYIYFLYLIKY